MVLQLINHVQSVTKYIVTLTTELLFRHFCSFANIASRQLSGNKSKSSEFTSWTNILIAYHSDQLYRGFKSLNLKQYNPFIIF